MLKTLKHSPKIESLARSVPRWKTLVTRISCELKLRGNEKLESSTIVGITPEVVVFPA